MVRVRFEWWVFRRKWVAGEGRVVFMNADSESIFALPMQTFASSSTFSCCVRHVAIVSNESVLPLWNVFMVQHGFSRRIDDLVLKPVSQRTFILNLHREHGYQPLFACKRSTARAGAGVTRSHRMWPIRSEC